MTKKHFEAIAAELRRTMEDGGMPLFASEIVTARKTVEVVSRRLADRFSEFNPAFNKARFIKACKGE